MHLFDLLNILRVCCNRFRTEQNFKSIISSKVGHREMVPELLCQHLSRIIDYVLPFRYYPDKIKIHIST